jgi:abortive infection bacteriophage resistance protein
MKTRNFQTYNSLMKHMRSNGIQINGSQQKVRLKTIGYYHGYKGYRFFRKSENLIRYESFAQLDAVIEFDESLKALLYSPLMQLETAIKSYVCDAIVTSVGSSSFAEVFKKGFDLSDKGQCYRTRDSINASITKRYQSSQIVQHYYNQDKIIPVWAIFEELMLGDISSIIDVLDPRIKLQVSSSFGIPQGMNTNGILLPKIILAVKDLRNAIAHNKVVFDGRYIEFKKRESLTRMLSMETGISSITLDGLLDDIILVSFLMKNLGFRKDIIKKTYSSLVNELKKLKQRIPNRLYQQVTQGFTKNKLEGLKVYIWK